MKKWYIKNKKTHELSNGSDSELLVKMIMLLNPNFNDGNYEIVEK